MEDLWRRSAGGRFSSSTSARGRSLSDARSAGFCCQASGLGCRAMRGGTATNSTTTTTAASIRRSTTLPSNSWDPQADLQWWVALHILGTGFQASILSNSFCYDELLENLDIAEADGVQEPGGRDSAGRRPAAKLGKALYTHSAAHENIWALVKTHY